MARDGPASPPSTRALVFALAGQGLWIVVGGLKIVDATVGPRLATFLYLLLLPVVGLGVLVLAPAIRTIRRKHSRQSQWRARLAIVLWCLLLLAPPIAATL